jgi:hypothetical protein
VVWIDNGNCTGPYRKERSYFYPHLPTLPAQPSLATHLQHQLPALFIMGAHLPRYTYRLPR